MGLKEYCLFCEDEVIIKQASSPVKDSDTASATTSSSSHRVPKLETLCHRLKIKLPTKGKSLENTEGDAVNYYRLFENMRPYFNGEKKILSTIDNGKKWKHNPKLCTICSRKLSVLAKLFELLQETEERIEKRRKQLINLILSSSRENYEKGKKERHVVDSKVCSNLMNKKELEPPELVQMLKCFVQKGMEEEKKDSSRSSSTVNNDPPPAAERKVIKVVIYEQEKVRIPGLNSRIFNENLEEHHGQEERSNFIDENDDDDDDRGGGPENDSLSNDEADDTGGRNSIQETRSFLNKPLIIDKPKVRATPTTTASFHQESSTYSCRYCQESFSTPLEYYNHRRLMHPSHFESLSNVSLIPNSSSNIQGGGEGNAKESWQCNLCGGQFISKNLLEIIDHMACHEAVDPLATDSSSPSNFFPKGEPPISPPNPYQCGTCGAKFKWKVNLDLHKLCFHESSGVVQLICDQCGDATFNTREKLIRHLKEDHVTKKAYSCKNCPVSCSTLRKLMDHLQNSHADTTRLLCPNPKCTMVFTSFTQLNQHCREKHIVNKSVLSEKLKFSCGECKRSFISNAGYDAHLKRCASNKTKDKRRNVPIATSSNFNRTPIAGPAHKGSFVCSLCPGKTFKTARNLAGHQKTVHSNTEKKYKCQHCGKGFNKKCDLNRHVEQVHKKIRYQCDFCPKSFTCLNFWRNHTEAHTNVADVTCSICQRVLASKASLRVHMARHNKAKPVPDNELLLQRHRREAHLSSVNKTNDADGHGEKLVVEVSDEENGME